MGKAVEVMIQHVENLRRTYTKEHAELLELREHHLLKDRPFISHTGSAHTHTHTRTRAHASSYTVCSLARFLAS